MFKGVIRGYVATADENIPLVQFINSNKNVVYNGTNRTIEFRKPGYYDIAMNITLTDVPVGNVELVEYVNGIPSYYIRSAETSTETTDMINIIIHDVMHIIPATLENEANVSFRLSTACTVENAVILVEGRK